MWKLKYVKELVHWLGLIKTQSDKNNNHNNIEKWKIKLFDNWNCNLFMSRL